MAQERRTLDPKIVQRLELASPTTLAALLRIERRISQGFQGEITLVASRGGIASIRWSQIEMGDVIREELSG